MRWTVHGERTLYDSEWMSMTLVDVELPSGDRFEHHVVRFPQPASATVIHDPARGVLLLRRHRFTVDSVAWEVPAGRSDPGESAAEAARRETAEETGWRPGPLRSLGAFYPMPGSVDQTFHVFLADEAEQVGEPDEDEAGEVAWVPVEQVHTMLRDGSITDGFSLVALYRALAI